MKKTWFSSLLFIMLFFSTVHGQWEKVGNGILGSYNLVYGGALSTKNGIVWAGQTDLWKSVDTGKTWQKTNFTEGSFICQISFFDQNNGIVATYDLGIFLTRDGGNSWKNILPINECLGATMNRTKDEILAIDRSGRGTSHYSSDGGLTWQSQMVETDGTYHILARGNGQAYILSRSMSPYETHILESSDFGLTWQQHKTGVDYDSYSFALDSCNPKQIYIGNEEFNHNGNNLSEIFSSTDGGDSWTSVLKEPLQFFSSACETSANAVFAASSQGQGIYRSTDAGKNWKSIGGPDSHEDSRMLTVLNDNIIFASDNSGNIWRTVNSGGDSLAFSPGIGGKLQFSLSSKRIIKDSTNITVSLPIYLNCTTPMPSFDMVLHYPTIPLTYLNSVSLFGKSLDIPGQAWSGRAKIHFDAADLAARKDSLIGFAIFTWTPFEANCAHIIFDSISSEILDNPCSGKTEVIASTSDGIIGSFPSCGLAKETDVDPPRFDVWENKNSFTDMIDIDDGRTTDEGLRSIRWAAEIGTDTNKIKVLGIAPPIAPCYDDKISHSILISQLDSSAAGCYDFTFTDCLGHQSYTTICMFAHTNSGVEDEAAVSLKLEANHPNPFSRVTTFTYQISGGGMTRLTLYDDLGKEVSRIAQGTQSPGRYSISFDGSKLPSGNYIVRLENAGKAISRRVVIER